MALTTKQKLFCEAYLSNGFNAFQACIEAGYSEKTAGEMGYENLNKPQIRQHIDKSIDIILGSKKELTKQLIDEMKKYAFMSDEEMERLQVRASDKKGYIEMLGKYLTLFIDRKETKHTTVDDEGKEVGINTKNISEEQAKEMFYRLKNEN